MCTSALSVSSDCAEGMSGHTLAGTLDLANITAPKMEEFACISTYVYRDLYENKYPTVETHTIMGVGKP